MRTHIFLAQRMVSTNRGTTITTYVQITLTGLGGKEYILLLSRDFMLAALALALGELGAAAPVTMAATVAAVSW